MKDEMMTEYAQAVGKDAIRISRLLPGPLEKIWAYIVDPEKRSRWCCAGKVEQRVGGTIELHFSLAALADGPDVAPPEKHKDHPGEHKFSGKVLAIEPMRLLRHTWEYEGDFSELQFELEEQGDKVLLTLTHTRLVDRSDQVDVCIGWHTYLDILEDVLAGHPRRPFWKRFTELNPEYEKRVPD
jgi:uncharacterized protein YndB with AHSA1/START domain